MGNKMKGKLSKTDKDNYTLFDEKGIPIGTTPNVLSNNTFSKLSKQNCDEIFGVVDVEELADEHYKENKSNYITYKSFKDGFNKAMELNKDKVFTLEDMKRAFKVGFSNGFASDIISQDKLPTEKENLFNEFIQSIQQPSEIEVEIEMGWNPKSNYCSECGSGGKYMDNPCDHKNDCLHWSPILDGDGCLILKKV
jgi:hypothetical protein